MALSLSIVIPVLNESGIIGQCLDRLQSLRDQGVEVIVVDGGSGDDTVALAEPQADIVITSQCGRARQMNAGAALAKGKWLLFLHADSQLPDNLADIMMVWDISRSKWGFFALRLDGGGLALRIIEWFMNRRSYYTGIGTGDQCQFVEREVFNQIGGYPDIPLMEDIALSKRLKRISRPLFVIPKARTSSRRWRNDGILKTVLLMWRLRLAYFLGVTPEKLVQKYYPRQ